MNIVNNIDLVQLNIKNGVEEYYLPKNVNWRDKTIDKIVVALAPDGLTSPLLSPIDGQTQVLNRSAISNLYCDLYAADDTQIVRNLCFEELLYTNNHILPIGYKLSLNLSRFYFSQEPETEGCILLYVFYNDKPAYGERKEATESITVNVPLAANGKISLRDIVDTYIYMQPNDIKGVYVWNWETAPCYLTLRYADNIHTLNYVLSSLCRPPIYAGDSAEDIQIMPFMLDNINIDMLNSYVQNGRNTEVDVKLTFLY